MVASFIFLLCCAVVVDKKIKKYDDDFLQTTQLANQMVLNPSYIYSAIPILNKD